jgi:hypothetical protein
MTVLPEEERQTLRLVITAMKQLLLKTLSPRRAAGLGGLMQCPRCSDVGASLRDVRHKNCLWLQLRS